MNEDKTENRKLKLSPGDWIIIRPGLKIENVSKEYEVEILMPEIVEFKTIK